MYREEWTLGELGRGAIRIQNSFDEQLRIWVKSACSDWGYKEPSEEYFTRIEKRLPEELRMILGSGLDAGIIVPKGKQFTLKGLGPKKGPYSWFSNFADSIEPLPNWEYFFQVAEYVRLYPVALARGLRLGFEDNLMDITLRQGNELLVYCEVKTEKIGLPEYVNRIRQHEENVDLEAKDPGNDPLQKAKYLARHRPAFFYITEFTDRVEFRVEYPEGKAFQLVEEAVPWIRPPY